ncbi:hypothetical protein CPB84DRAFT_1676689 [Gymnopilus junonius]|uniref:GST N-terminal domain-containing protein n=1 Tax=Gymnopilus junonius TaxID=109634 RepID=A0A9P5NSX2_GYMJU|nr:hypothetical protein CPB84DRAFT_1676689 [Gymnopilus junonius]
MTNLPKAVLYYSPKSVWSAAGIWDSEEKGYGSDEIDRRVVDLGKGENYDPTFLRLNPKATVPVLVVPYENSLGEDTESRYKALIETKVGTPSQTIVEFLDKSRSAISSTQTTSAAPAPALSPATIAATMSCSVIIDILHAETANPNTLVYVNARDDESLKTLAKGIAPSLQRRQEALKEYLSQAENGSIRVSDKVKKLWVEKLDATGLILAVLVDAEKPQEALGEQAKANRIAFFRTARQAWEVNMSDVFTQLSKEMAGPYALGDQFSIADLHLGGWLSRVAKLAGATKEDDGSTVVSKLEKRIGGGFGLPRDFITEQARRENSKTDRVTKVGAFWDALRERGSWKKVYETGLY